VPAHRSLKTTEFVTNSNMVIVLHPSYSPDLAPCDFSLFPKFKIKLKDDILKLSDMQRECQAVLDSIKENYFHVLLKLGKSEGTAVYIPKESILKEMAAKIE
jgi:hypothetical protein